MLTFFVFWKYLKKVAEDGEIFENKINKKQPLVHKDPDCFHLAESAIPILTIKNMLEWGGLNLLYYLKIDLCFL